MAKQLIFNWRGCEVPFEMNKVDRAKLYGYKELEVFDENGERCELATLAEDGHTIIGRGGTGFGYLTADGFWSEKSALKAVDSDGREIEPVTSSFNAPIDLLDAPISVDDYLNHTIRSVYSMGLLDPSPLTDILRSGSIYKFPFSYRGGLESDTAFLIANDQGDIFMTVGRPTEISMIGLQRTTVSVSEDESDLDSADDDLDFGMI